MTTFGGCLNSANPSPAVGAEGFERAEAALVVHLAVPGDPVAQVKMLAAVAPRPFDLFQDRQRAQAARRRVRIVERVHRRQGLVADQVGDRHAEQPMRGVLAQLHEAALRPGANQELVEFEGPVVVHAATAVARAHPAQLLDVMPSDAAGTPVQLPAVYSDSVNKFQWSMPEGLSCTTCPQPYAKPRSDTKYKVEFSDHNGCRNAAEVQVLVVCGNDNVFMPNTFSPNGDGSNDIFYVRGKGLSRVKTLRIFNRWGQVVFEKRDFPVNEPSVGWDGFFKGQRPQSDVYIYQVEVFCENSQVIRYEGNVALIL